MSLLENWSAHHSDTRRARLADSQSVCLLVSQSHTQYIVGREENSKATTELYFPGIMFIMLYTK